ncbi:hypothetical protein [Actinoplanes sp. NPDC051859]|uniref:hypothetical protein n=1 Tax=Actinoplanes sp. NPDC051859 TaxID=3363909 RepID=UPI0037B07C81
MADGSTKAFADVRVGDKVLATDPETNQTAAKEVTDLWIHEACSFLGNRLVVVHVVNCDDLMEAYFLSLLTDVVCRSCEWAAATHDEDGDLLDRPSSTLHFVFTPASENVAMMLAVMRRSGRVVQFADGRGSVS